MKHIAIAGVLVSAVAALTGTVLIDAGRASATRRTLGTGTMTVDLAAPGTPIPPTLYGIFFEEKLLNTGDAPATMTVNLASSREVSSSARVITMQSARPTDENSFEEPRKIVPVETTRTGVGATFAHELPPYSLTILRVRGT